MLAASIADGSVDNTNDNGNSIGMHSDNSDVASPKETSLKVVTTAFLHICTYEQLQSSYSIM
jgi:hypothetical protein